MKTLMKDPLNLICVGVAGQGNVVISTLISNTLVNEGYLVTFAQVYGGNQRGGAVVNYVRISKEIQYSPMMLPGQADIVLGLEPLETLRMLGQYGNPDVVTIVNPRPIYSIEVTTGQAEYPDLDELMETIKELSAKTWIINATEEARELGDIRVVNVLLSGALIGSGTLPLDKKSLEPAIRERFPKAIERNMMALNRGWELTAA